MWIIASIAMLCLSGCGSGGGGGEAANGNQNGSSSPVSPPQSSGGVQTATATLAWDAVAASSLGGYRLYYGTTPGRYLQARGQGLNVGRTTSYTVTGLTKGTTYYFAVTAYDLTGVESGFSNEDDKNMI